MGTPQLRLLVVLLSLALSLSSYNNRMSSKDTSSMISAIEGLLISTLRTHITLPNRCMSPTENFMALIIQPLIQARSRLLQNRNDR